MSATVTPFLMFTGRCEEAVNFYVSLFADGEITRIDRWGEGAPTEAGKIMRCTFRLAGRDFAANDSPPVHAFDFTPSLSLFVDAEDEAQLDRLFAALSEGGGVLMPLGAYGFSRRFGWVNDRFGVSWQLNLP